MAKRKKEKTVAADEHVTPEDESAIDEAATESNDEALEEVEALIDEAIAEAEVSIDVAEGSEARVVALPESYWAVLDRLAERRGVTLDEWMKLHFRYICS